MAIPSMGTAWTSPMKRPLANLLLRSWPNTAVDAIVNTVGGYAGGVKLWELDTAVFDRMLSMNLRSGYALSRAVVPAMLKQKHGAIVNVAAKAAYDHAAGASAYAASKAAALAMIDCLAADLTGTGVRANSILPSIIDTEANRKAMPGADYATWPKPEDIARVILFLCSDDARVVHGAANPPSTETAEGFPSFWHRLIRTSSTAPSAAHLHRPSDSIHSPSDRHSRFAPSSSSLQHRSSPLPPSARAASFPARRSA